MKLFNISFLLTISSVQARRGGTIQKKSLRYSAAAAKMTGSGNSGSMTTAADGLAAAGRLLGAVAGATVTLNKCMTVDNTCTQVCETVTDKNGDYGDSPCFSSIQPTDNTFYYQVCIENPLGPKYGFTPGMKKGVQDVTPTNSTNRSIACSNPTLVPNNTVAIVNGELATNATKAPVNPPSSAPVMPQVVMTPPPSNVTGRVFNDTNGNGVQDATEKGSPNQKVTLSSCDGATNVTVYTDANGDFIFPNIIAGSCYTTTVGNSGVCSFTADVNSTTGSSDKFILSSGETKKILAGIYCPVLATPPATVTGTIFNDTNSNGLQDGTEAGIPNKKVTLLNGNGDVVQTTSTDTTGAYTFPTVPAGSNYTVSVGSPNSSSDCSFTGGDLNTSSGSSSSFSLTSGQTKDISAGIYCPSEGNKVSPCTSNDNPSAVSLNCNQQNLFL